MEDQAHGNSVFLIPRRKLGPSGKRTSHVDFHSMNMQSPYEKNLYRPCTACSYARSTFSLPANADTSMSSEDFGK
jgi:hypothetical protein